MKIIKQTAGSDVSKDTIALGFGTISDNQDIKILKPVIFENNLKGFREIMAYIKKVKVSDDIPLYFVMEATGVYYEKFAYFLAEKHQKVIVVLPNKIKHYSKTLEIKSKTDKLDAEMITRFGLERKMELWQVPSQIMKELKSLTREYRSNKTLATQIKNQLHAKEHSHQPLKQTIKRSNQVLTVLEKQCKEIEKQIKELIKSDDDLNNRIDRIEKIEGIGRITIASVIAETNGFALIDNAKQLASYSGLDVVYNESGQKKGKTSISKKGNKNIRSALFMPAMTACRHNPKMKELYNRLLENKKLKRVAQIAVARKLLILMYTIFKKDIEYIPNYNPALA
jgi:transposase